MTGCCCSSSCFVVSWNISKIASIPSQGYSTPWGSLCISPLPTDEEWLAMRQAPRDVGAFLLLLPGSGK